MTAKFKIEKKNLPKIVLTGNTCNLSREIYNQLKSQPHLLVTDSDIKQLIRFDNSEALILINFLGFGSPNLEQTLQASVYLYQLLNFTYDSGSKLIIVTPSSSQHLIQTSLLLIHQFYKNKKFDFEIVEIDSSLNPSQLAEAIIRKFFYNYKYHFDSPRKSGLSGNFSPSSISKHRKKMFTRFSTWIVIFILLALFYLSALIAAAKLFSGSEIAFQQNTFNKAYSTAQKSLWLSQNPLLRSSINKFQISTLITYLELLKILKSSSNFPIPNRLFQPLESNLLSWIRSSSPPSAAPIRLYKDLVFIRTLNSRFDYLITLLDNQIGLDKPIRVAVISQDPHQLSSTGGIISKIFLFTLDAGKLLDISQIEPQDLNTQSIGSVAAPLEYQQLTQQSKLLFTQLDWNPDVSQSLSYMSSSLRNYLGSNIDIIVTTNKYSPGQLENIISGYNSLSQSSKNSILFDVFSQMEKRQAFIYPAQNHDWSGAIKPANCRIQSSCLKFFLYYIDTSAARYISEKNFSKNIQVNHQFTQDSVVSTLTINNPNISSLNYHYLYFPSNLKLTDFKIADQSLLPNATIFPNNNGLTKIGFTLPQVSGNLTLTLSQNIPAGSDHFVFQIDVPNQPGNFTGSLITQISYPKTWLATTYSKPAVVSMGILGYNSPISEFAKINVDFHKN